MNRAELQEKAREFAKAWNPKEPIARMATLIDTNIEAGIQFATDFADSVLSERPHFVTCGKCGEENKKPHCYFCGGELRAEPPKEEVK